ncbi:MAG: Panacea domain-containing protein [Nitrosopumilus sp.]|nr:Panacea domain-containing protein [Nitrosopumilus sp.]
MSLVTNLLDEFPIPLEIISHDSEIRGKVRLQKLVFLSQVQLGKKYDFEFEPAPLGPLSDRVNYLLGRMTELGIIEEKIKSTASGNDVYCYRITATGKKFLESAKQNKVLSKEEIKTIDSVFKKYGKMSYVELLDLVHKKYPEYHLKEVTLY